jgi:hypothetical protein
MYARQLFEYTKPKLNNNELIWLDINYMRQNSELSEGG